MDSKSRKRVLLFGIADRTKPRLRILLRGISAKGWEVFSCDRQIWGDVTDKSQIKGFLNKGKIAFSWLVSYPALLVKYLRSPAHDFILVGYPGVVDVYVAWAIAKLTGKKLVWDVFISLYDTIVLDRKIWPKRSMRAVLLYWMEYFAFRLVDKAFLDTSTHARHIETLFKLRAKSLGAVWVGAESIFFEEPEAENIPCSVGSMHEQFSVLFYGQLIPLHGIEKVILAASLLKNESINWVIIGSGQQSDKVRDLLRDLNLSKVKWVDWVPYPDLPSLIRSVDLCLGIFGDSEKARSVIPNKVFQVIACRQPILTMESAGMNELLGEDIPSACCINLVAPEAQSIADRVLYLSQQESGKIRCDRSLSDKFTPEMIGEMFVNFVEPHV